MKAFVSGNPKPKKKIKKKTNQGINFESHLTMPQLPLIYKDNEIKKTSKVFRALGHPLRKKILDYLALKEKATVTEIYVALRIKQPVASQQLKILKEVKVVEAKRIGKNIFYKPNYDILFKLEKIVSKIVTEIVSN